MRISSKIVISALIAALVFIAAIFIFRFQMLQFSANAAIRKILPKYVVLDNIKFDARANRITLTGFKILNPGGFSKKYLLEIDSIACSYKKKGKRIIDGFEVLEPVLTKPVLNIERLHSGTINLIEMQSVINNTSSENVSQQQKDKKQPEVNKIGNVKISDIIKLPEQFRIDNGRMVFIDRLNGQRPITIENIESNITVNLDDLYERLLKLDSEGSGNINGRTDEVVKWYVSWNPTTPRLTMSNRFEVNGVTIKTFEPYYDRYSPFLFTAGKFSGDMTFDFDNGNIGSTNEIRLSGIKFSVKPGYEYAGFWETTVPDLIKYFTSSAGEIIFDFKIKGDMLSPKFFLGPISKQAIAAMAVDKISQAVAKASESQGNNSDIQKVKDYIDLFKGVINKK